MGNTFDSANYLRGLGWSGPGSSLNGSAHGRAKPVTVIQKKTLAGVGRDRDTSFAWWDAIFTSVASKVGGEKKNEQQRLTSTGILSHRPPAAQGNAHDAESSTAASGSRLNLDAMAAAKIEYARRQLYSGFLRGSTLKPAEEAQSVPATKGKENTAPVAAEGSSRKRKRDEDGEGEGDKGSKAERKEERRKRKEEKALKKATKEAKRAAKARKEKGKGKEEVPLVAAAAVTVEDDGDVVLIDAVEISTTTTPPAELDPSSSSSSKLSREERRAAKKLHKSLGVLSPSLPTSYASSTSVPRDYLSPEEALAAEEQAYLEAKEAARRAEKEERRLEKVVKKALKEKGRETKNKDKS
ncbi:hypothetical protein JCM11251_006890 [Rhodosporidiobolus azoricus]